MAAGANVATADDTGMASMHAWRKEKGRTCFVDHTHYGSSAGHPSQKIAQIEAVKSWSGFTAWEYGTVWANFNKATAKVMKCDQSGGSWGCSVEARPCR